MITGKQVAAARGLFGIQQEDLAERAGTSVATLKRIEASEGIPNVNAVTLAVVQYELEVLGCQFIGLEGVTSGRGQTGFRGITVDPRKMGKEIPFEDRPETVEG